MVEGAAEIEYRVADLGLCKDLLFSKGLPETRIGHCGWSLEVWDREPPTVNSKLLP